jgi:hypothetical protein
MMKLFPSEIRSAGWFNINTLEELFMTKPKQAPRADTHKIWNKVNGPVPDGHEIHHIIPKHAGGEDIVENLEAVTPTQHAERHLTRYKETGDFRDLCAYYMIGYNFTEAHRISSSNGGKVGGKKVYNTGVGIFRSEADRKVWASMGGKVGGIVQRDNKLGIHGLSEEQRKANSSAAGKKGSFTMSHIQSANGKKGGVKNKGFVWLTDGSTSIKYSSKLQQEKSVEQFLLENPTFKRGRS